MSSNHHVNVIGHAAHAWTDGAVRSRHPANPRPSCVVLTPSGERVDRAAIASPKVPIVNIGRVRASIAYLCRRTKLLQMWCPDGVRVATSRIVGKPEPVRRENDVVCEDGASHCLMTILGVCVRNGSFGSRRSRSRRCRCCYSPRLRRDGTGTGGECHRQHAPQTATRPAPFSVLAPPTKAAAPPRPAEENSEVPERSE